MITLDTFAKRFTGLKRFVHKRGTELLIKHNEAIVKMQKDQHLAGVNKQDKIMQQGYSSGYAKRRKKKGLQTSYVDLHFTGKYHKGLKVRPDKEGVNVESNVEYEKYLRERFEGMAGLTKKNADVISNIIAKELAIDIKKYLVE
jgi:hypothetical protein